MSQHAQEVLVGQRFEFGENWLKFISLLNEERIHEAESSLKLMLGVESLHGKSFLDIGSGSGLFSLAARRLGARVHSFDYDPKSVACTAELRRRFFPNDTSWTVEEGSVLSVEYLKSLGQFDVVYSWGVLHHTGEMWRALGYVTQSVTDNGRLFIAIYNDQGRASDVWRAIKRVYNRLPRGLHFLVLWPVFIALWGAITLRDILVGKPFRTWRYYAGSRGMSPWQDLVDWVGGYPFEVATPEQIVDFYREHNFVLIKLKTCAGKLGCNQFVFRRDRTQR